MEKVTGIGGVFFHSDRAEELANWYERHLGVRKVGVFFHSLIVFPSAFRPN